MRDGLLPDNCENRKHSVVFTELVAIRHTFITSFCAHSECRSPRTAAAQAAVIYTKVGLVCVFNLGPGYTRDWLPAYSFVLRERAMVLTGERTLSDMSGARQ